MSTFMRALNETFESVKLKLSGVTKQEILRVHFLSSLKQIKRILNFISLEIWKATRSHYFFQCTSLGQYSVTQTRRNEVGIFWYGDKTYRVCIC